MSAVNNPKKQGKRQILQNISNTGISKCKFILCSFIIPRSAKCATMGKNFCVNKLIPCLYIGTRLVKHEFIKIHEKQSWFQRCGATFAGNAIGLSMAMLSTKVVEHFVEVRDVSNLWGLLASRPVVSDTTYEVFSFVVEFVIALIVFTLTEHFYEELMHKREEKTLAIETED